MKKPLIKIDKKFKPLWKHYVLQSLFATITVFIVILILSMQHAVIVASLGATTFLVFALPNSRLAGARNILGGYLVGLSCGFLLSLIPPPGFLNVTIATSLIYACSVGLAIFIMVITDSEHPPAAGVALAIAIDGFSWPIVLAILITALTLSLIHIYFHRFLKDLA